MLSNNYENKPISRKIDSIQFSLTLLGKHGGTDHF